MKKCEMSPLKLLQEIYHPNEWRILICVLMLNQTSGKQVHGVIKELFKKYPNPKSMANANPRELRKIIETCGLANKRSLTLIRFSQEFLWKDWQEPRQLHGIGQYGQDSYDIFIRNKKIAPSDKELKKYIQWKYKT